MPKGEFMQSLNLQLGDDVQLQSTSQTLPTGNYNVGTSKAELVETKSGGMMINITLKVTDGPQTGKEIIERLNVHHLTSEAAVKIGKSKLKTLMTFGGHANPQMLGNVTELVGLNLRIIVEEYLKEYDGRQIRDCDIKAYAKADGNPSVSQEPIAIAEATNNAQAQTAQPVPETANPFTAPPAQAPVAQTVAQVAPVTPPPAQAPVAQAPVAQAPAQAPASSAFPWNN